MKLLNLLQDTRVVLENHMPHFPHWKCDDTSDLLHLAYGFEIVVGNYVPQDDYHCWNRDPRSNLYIDLTQDQFEYSRDRIVVTPVTAWPLRANPLKTQQRQRTTPTTRYAHLVPVLERLAQSHGYRA